MWSKSLLFGYGTGQSVIDVNLEGINEEESLFRPEQGGNCINWLAGHILATRGLILTHLGSEAFLGDEEAKPYSRGALPLGPGDTCLSLSRIREGLTQTAALVSEKIAPLGEKELAGAIDPDLFPFPVENPTVGDFLTRLLFHESYHTGQLGTLRRLVGKEGGIA